MDSTDLLFGPYAPPDYQVGGALICNSADRMVIVAGTSKAPIPWPCGKKSGQLVPILCGELARAVCMETTNAVAYHWGVSKKLATQWRKKFGVPRNNPGTQEYSRSQVRSRVLSEEAIAKRIETQASPQFRAKRKAKLAEMIGNPQAYPAMTAWNPNKTLKKWSEDHIALLGTMPDREVANKIERSPQAVYLMRTRLGIDPYKPS